MQLWHSVVPLLLMTVAVVLLGKSAAPERFVLVVWLGCSMLGVWASDATANCSTKGSSEANFDLISLTLRVSVGTSPDGSPIACSWVIVLW